MTPEEFKQWGYRFVDWAADYMAHPENHAVLSQISPGDVRKHLPAEPPAKPESFEQMLHDLDRIIVPGLTHWNHPFSTVCFRLRAGDAENHALIDRVNASGKLFISHTRLNDKLTLRFAIGNVRSAEEHVRAAWEEIRKP